MSDLFVDNIKHQSSQGSGTITLGASGETIALASGAQVSGFTGQNYPAFQARLSANTTVSDAVLTQIQFNTKEFDTDNYYDNTTNYRFTPLVAGKYFFYLKYLTDTAASDTISYTGYLYKNNALYTYNFINYDANYGEGGGVTLNAIIDLNGSTDYVDGRVFVNTLSGASATIIANSNETYFGAFRIGA